MSDTIIDAYKEKKAEKEKKPSKFGSWVKGQTSKVKASVDEEVKYRRELSKARKDNYRRAKIQAAGSEAANAARRSEAKRYVKPKLKKRPTGRQTYSNPFGEGFFAAPTSRQAQSRSVSKATVVMGGKRKTKRKKKSKKRKSGGMLGNLDFDFDLGF